MSVREMTAEVGAEQNYAQREKLEGVQILSEGLHPAIFVGVASIGTFHNDKFNKDNKEIILFFEFPGLKQKRYVDDKEETPEMVSRRMTYSTYRESALVKGFLKTLLGHIPDDGEIVPWHELVGKKVTANISHAANKKEPSKPYVNIDSISLYAEALATGIDMTQTNESFTYDISWGFECEEYTNLYGWVRKRIKESIEGKAHAANGGAFADPKKKEESDGNIEKTADQPAHIQKAKSTAETNNEPKVDDLPF